MPSTRSIADIKSALLHPATTSHFEVKIDPTWGDEIRRDYLSYNGVNLNQGKLNLLCSEATLPGSNLATLELTNDHTGVTERHAYRRVYDDRIDLTFYVDAENYLPIRFFETWMKWIANESKAVDGNIGASLASDNYFYRFRYRDSYVSKQGLEVTKFERSTSSYDSKYNYKKKATSLTYKFVNAFPISLSSMPVSYDSSTLLKCNVSMSYIRYFIDRTVDEGSSSVSTPTQQAQFNSSNLTLPGLEGSGALTTGGISQSTANSSGNTIDRRIEAGLPGVGRNNFVERSIFGP
jgi:hypothetical protein